MTVSCLEILSDGVAFANFCSYFPFVTEGYTEGTRSCMNDSRCILSSPNKEGEK